MARIALVTGASSGFGRMIARELAGAGHTACASMRDVEGRNASATVDNARHAAEQGIDLRSVELDASVAAAVAAILAAHGRCAHSSFDCPEQTLDTLKVARGCR